MKSSVGTTATMTIGELSARFDLAPHVLRHWEAMGLLAPAARVNGRRRYSRDHITRVAMIVGGKAGGLSLEQLRDLLAARSPDDRRELLERHHADLERRIRDIEHSKAMVEHALGCDEHDFTQCPDFKRLVEHLADGGSHGRGRTGPARGGAAAGTRRPGGGTTRRRSGGVRPGW
jgi:MerR family transcriptional regulator, copper efflux regulator